MPSLSIYDLNKKKIGSVEANDAVFAGEIKPHLINEAVRVQIARRYEWKTANSRTRGEVHGTRKKMYKQKGTGQARHGDAKAPIFVGGAKAHGPKPRLVVKKMNKKAMKGALISVLSHHQKKDALFIIDRMEFDKPSTKKASAIMKSFGLEKALFVNACESNKETSFNQSIKNIKHTKFLQPNGVNVFDVLKYKNLLISKKALEKLTERLANANI